MLLCDGKSKTTITASLKDNLGLPVKTDGVGIFLELTGPGVFKNNLREIKISTVNGVANFDLYSTKSPEQLK